MSADHIQMQLLYYQHIKKTDSLKENMKLLNDFYHEKIGKE